MGSGLFSKLFPLLGPSSGIVSWLNRGGGFFLVAPLDALRSFTKGALSACTEVEAVVVVVSMPRVGACVLMRVPTVVTFLFN